MDERYAQVAQSEIQVENSRQQSVNVIVTRELKSWLSGDFGESRQYHVPVAELIGARVRVSAFLVAEANLGALGLGVGEPMPPRGAMLLELDNSALIAQSHWVYLPIALLVIVLLILESFTTEVETHA
jgi:ABC-type dipeptide/oligopeptide/nickel transport system permease component